MKKILAIIGSPSSNTSNTRALVEDFVALVKNSYPDCNHEIIMLGDKKIEYCNECYTCTKTGYCSINDDLKEIQEKMVQSDLIIFGSPVFMNNVSGQMKTFFDRLFLWMHIVKLIGKPAIVATTTAYSGQKYTEKYLIDTTIGLGTINVGKLKAIGCYKPGHFPNREKIKIKYAKLAIKTANILMNRIQPKPNFKNNWFFTGMKKKAYYGKEFLPYEYNYWESKGWFKLSYKKALQQEKLGGITT